MSLTFAHAKLEGATERERENGKVLDPEDKLYHKDIVYFFREYIYLILQKHSFSYKHYLFSHRLYQISTILFIHADPQRSALTAGSSASWHLLGPLLESGLG